MTEPAIFEDPRRLKRAFYLELMPKIPFLPQQNRVKRYHELALVSDIEFMEPLMNQLSHEGDEEVCKAICKAIAAAGDDAILFLLDVLNKPDLSEHLQKYALIALTANDWVAHLNQMIPYLGETRLVSVIIECLLDAGIAAVPVIVNELSYPNLDVRRWLKQVLSEMPQADVMSVLEKYEVLPEEDTLIDIFGADVIRSLPGSQSAQRY